MNIYIKRTLRLSILAGLCWTIGVASAQKHKNTIAYLRDDASVHIPLNPKVRSGKLDNGFQYFIMKNTEPKDRMVMYMANKVGSILETEEQLGLAHFLEHMNFNGTTHFPKNELVEYLQKSGIRFGADLNAYTGFDETVYQLPLPSNNPELVEKGLIIMRDWAHGALLEEDEIDQERGVILEEKRQRGGLSTRIQDQTFPMVTNNSRYAFRMPIGTEEVLKNFDYATIRNFYTDWYRPELQALIMVGDIDVDKMETEVIRLFSDLKNPSDAPKRMYYNIRLDGKNNFLTLTDAELSDVNLQISFKSAAFKIQKPAHYRESLERQIFTQLLNQRLGELTRKNATPFLSAGFGMSELLGGLETHTINIVPKPNKLKESVVAVYETFEQVRRYGFTENELARIKTSFMVSMDRSRTEQSKQSSQAYIKELLDYYLKGSPAPDFEYIYPIMRSSIEAITVADLHKYTALYTKTKNRDMILVGPKNESENLPDEKLILSWIKEAKKTSPVPYIEEVVQDQLVVNLPTEGSIVQKSKNEKVGTSTLLLNNGVKVVLKPTDFKNDEILITSYSPGGYSIYDEKDYQSAINAASVVTSSGLGEFNSLQLSKYLNGKNVSVSPYISEIGEGIKAFSAQKDLKTAFEMIHAYFYQARLDRELNESNIEKTKLSLQNQKNSVEAFFKDTISTILYNNDPRKTALTLEKINQIDLDRSFAIFKERFADASDFTFVIVGNFQEEEMEMYVKRYLATLPNLGRKENFVDNGAYPPNEGISADIYRGQEEKSTVVMAYMGDYVYTEENNLLMEALSSAVNIKLLQRLREKESGVYGVSVSPSLSKNPRHRYGLNISFTTDPHLVEKLTQATFEEIEKIKAEGPAQEDIDKFIAERLLGSERVLVQNNFWLSYLLSSEIDQKDPARVFDFAEQLKKVTKEEVKRVANTYLRESSLFKFVLYPEK